MKQQSQKSNIMLISLGIFFVFYNIILFIIFGFSGLSAAFWLSYFFVLASIALNVISRVILFTNRITAKDWFFSYPILRHGYIYLAAEFSASVIFMAVPGISIRLATVVQLVIMAVYLVFAISCLFAKTSIEELDEKVKDKVLFIRSMQLELHTITEKCDDQITKALIKSLTEKMRLSDPMSHEILFEMEKDIALEISHLKNDVEQRYFDTAKERSNVIRQLLEERNQKCKILK